MSDHKKTVEAEEALDICARCLDRRGVSGWDVYLEEEDSFAVEVRDGEVESLISARATGLCLRVIRDGRMGLAYANKLIPAMIEDAAARAFESAVFLETDPHNAIMGPDGGYPKLAIFDHGLGSISREDKIRQAALIESSALAYDPRLSRVRGAEYSEDISTIRILNSQGIRASASYTMLAASVEAVAEDKGQAQAAGEFETTHHYDKLDVARVGRSAAKKAVELLGAGPGATGRMPVVLSAEAASGLLAALSAAVCADNVDKGKSWLADKLGRRIASPAVTVLDNQLEATGPGAFPFDDEGVAARPVTVIREGVLESFLFDGYYGRKMGTHSTGNAVKGAFYLPPGVDSVNWMLLPGSRPEGDLIAQVERGLYIVELLGLHTVDLVTGEFSLGANGYNIRGGKPADPVSGLAIAGSLAELLGLVVEAASEIKWSGDAGSPALLVEEMDVSGRD